MSESCAYNLLKSYPDKVQGLFKHFIPDLWVKQVDFKSLQEVTIQSMAASNDPCNEPCENLLYRAKFDQGSEIYLLIFFPKHSEHWMVVHVANKIFLLYEFLIEEKIIKADSGLPPVFPLVLYSGQDPWVTSEDLRDLFLSTKPNALLSEFEPNLFYYLLEERLQPFGISDCEFDDAELVERSWEKISRMLENRIEVDEGQRMLLTKQLAKRFGPLPAWVQDKRVKGHSLQMEQWGLRLLDAENMEAVFTP